jgi:hypothetical protein
MLALLALPPSGKPVLLVGEVLSAVVAGDIALGIASIDLTVGIHGKVYCSSMSAHLWLWP